jgi:hypothetical protein
MVLSIGAVLSRPPVFIRDLSHLRVSVEYIREGEDEDEGTL